MGEDDRESEEVKLPDSPLKVALKWIGVISSLGLLVSIGIWVGTLQQRVDQNTSDIAECETAHKANAAKLVSAEKTERDRLNKMRDAVIVQFNSDKDELWELKMAMAAVNQRVATYHSTSPNYHPPAPVRTYGEGAPPAKVRPLSTAAKRKLAAKRADALIEDVMEESPEELPPPMPTF